MKHPQLLLDISRPRDFSLSAFARFPANEAALVMVQRWPDWQGPAVAIVGPRASGKTHLGLIWQERAEAQSTLLGDLCTDDLAQGLHAPLWLDHDGEGGAIDEQALFHALNLVREERQTLLITARTAPARWKVALPDLSSRLNAIPVVEIGAPEDGLIEAILMKRFTDAGMTVDEKVLPYLLTHMPRSFEAVAQVGEAMERETLARQKRVTVPLAKAVLSQI